MRTITEGAISGQSPLVPGCDDPETEKSSTALKGFAESFKGFGGFQKLPL